MMNPMMNITGEVLFGFETMIGASRYHGKIMGLPIASTHGMHIH